MKTQIIVFVFLMFGISIGYTNCAKFSTASSLISPATALCTEKLRADDSIRFDRTVCDDNSNYVCEVRTFSPTANDEKSESKFCADDSSCARVTLMNFNTEKARTAENSNAFDEGGDYNYTDIQCANEKALVNGVSVISGSGASLEQALSEARTKCEERTNL